MSAQYVPVMSDISTTGGIQDSVQGFNPKLTPLSGSLSGQEHWRTSYGPPRFCSNIVPGQTHDAVSRPDAVLYIDHASPNPHMSNRILDSPSEKYERQVLLLDHDADGLHDIDIYRTGSGSIDSLPILPSIKADRQDKLALTNPVPFNTSCHFINGDPLYPGPHKRQEALHSASVSALPAFRQSEWVPQVDDFVGKTYLNLPHFAAKPEPPPMATLPQNDHLKLQLDLLDFLMDHSGLLSLVKVTHRDLPDMKIIQTGFEENLKLKGHVVPTAAIEYILSKFRPNNMPVPDVQHSFYAAKWASTPSFSSL
ncbi:hypothetical protein BDN70DRAFT_929310 [Pholiota conissans]|uniref:Uncharacterized protein n=1 Tax=Pholiota conissans TaxID=109636 RepID=A0A9P6D558_9AGAR|nr:hypothetical protein BDN70DRAFT_929310 [Pholiota conissans]